jgi:hypothetical protein
VIDLPGLVPSNLISQELAHRTPVTASPSVVQIADCLLFRVHGRIVCGQGSSQDVTETSKAADGMDMPKDKKPEGDERAMNPDMRKLIMSFDAKDRRMDGKPDSKPKRPRRRRDDTHRAA